jgi:UDP-N-acetylmuramoyl-L-alanyl-D-glutamate--2,6-diaminopimelate ligase
VTLVELGHSPAEVERAMQEQPTVPGRMELVTATDPDPYRDPRCIVDYAHSAEAVEAALRALRPTTRGKLVAVLGAGGDRDRGKRAGMGAAAAEWADHVIITDDNPRSENAAAIRAEMRRGAAGRTSGGSPKVTDQGNRWKAIEAAVTLARRAGRPADNTVLVLGKGHETGQEIDGVVHAFDDREALRAALDGLVYRPEASA